MAMSPIALTFSKTQLPSPVVHDGAETQSETIQPTNDAGSDKRVEEYSAEPLEKALSRIDTADFPTTLPLIMITIALMLCVFLGALDMTIVATAIPRITDQFKSVDQVGWYGSAFFLTTGAFQSTWGKVFKYFPLKTSYIISIAIFEVGSLLCGVAQNSTTLIVGRAIAGAGCAGIASGAYTIIAFSVHPSKRPAYTGLLGSVFAIASVIGPLLGGVFTDNLSWRWCFYINLPIGGLAAVFVLAFFTTPKAARPQQATLKEKLLQLDFPGAFILMGSMTCLFLSLQHGGTTKPWSDGSIIAELVLFGVLLICFIIVEHFSHDRALLQGRLLKDRTLGAMCLFNFVLSGAIMIPLYYLPLYFQATRGDSPQESGIKNLPLVLGMSLFVIVSGVILTVTSLYIPLMIVGSILTSIACGLLYTLQITSGPAQWLGYQAMAGIGIGLTCQIPVMVCQAVVRPSDLSTISAMVLFFQTIGSAIWTSAGQAGWTNTMLKEMAIRVPDVNPALVLAVGATDLRRVFTPEQMVGVLDAYMSGLRVPLAIAIGCASLCVLLSVTPRWERINAKAAVSGAGA